MTSQEAYQNYLEAKSIIDKNCEDGINIIVPDAEIINKLKNIINNFQSIDFADDNIAVITYGTDREYPLKYDILSYLYFGPDDNGRYVYASNYGYGINIRETGNSLKDVADKTAMDIVNILKEAGYSINGVELDTSYLFDDLIINETIEQEVIPQNLSITTEEIIKDWNIRSSNITFPQYLDFAKNNNLYDSDTIKLFKNIKNFLKIS